MANLKNIKYSNLQLNVVNGEMFPEHLNLNNLNGKIKSDGVISIFGKGNRSLWVTNQSADDAIYFRVGDRFSFY